MKTRFELNALTLHLQPPGKRTSGMPVQAKLDAYLWFGSCFDSGHVLDHLPEGFFPDPSGGSGAGPPKVLLSAGMNSKKQPSSLEFKEPHLVIERSSL